MYANDPYLINKVTELTIQHNCCIKENVEKFTNLRKLEIFDRVLIGDNEIKHLTQLTSLDIYCNNTITIQSIRFLTNLVNLKVNKFIRQENLAYLTRLHTLSLGHIHYGCITEIHHLPNLTSLSLVSDKLIQDSELIKLCSTLLFLNLSGNFSITNDGLSKMTALKTLILDQNSNLKINNEWNTNDDITDKGLSNLTNLTSLSLVDNEIITDVCLMKLTNLQWLNISYNKTITFVSISVLKSLKELIFTSERCSFNFNEVSSKIKITDHH